MLSRHGDGMRGTDNRAANVIVTVLVAWIIGVPLACCGASFLLAGLGHRWGGIVGTLLVLGVMFGPGVFAWWWNYRRVRPPDPWP